MPGPVAHKAPGMAHTSHLPLRRLALDLCEPLQVSSVAFPWLASLNARVAVQLGLTELRGIPMAVLDRLDQVPAEYLTTLAESKDLFDELSPKLQRQVSSRGCAQSTGG